MPSEVKRYSQYEEDEIIAKFFGDRVGQFMDVGSHDGKINSNVRALMEGGWSGLCVEPSPTVFPYLMKNLVDFPKVQCLNAAIDDTERFVKFHDNNGDQMGTTDAHHRQQWLNSGSTYNPPFWLRTVTPWQIADDFPFIYNFISIDVEGTNLRVLKAFPFLQMGCDLICVEKEPGTEMVNYLRTIGYGNIQETTGNYLASR